MQQTHSSGVQQANNGTDGPFTDPVAPGPDLSVWRPWA